MTATWARENGALRFTDIEGKLIGETEILQGRRSLTVGGCPESAAELVEPRRRKRAQATGEHAFREGENVVHGGDAIDRKAFLSAKRHLGRDPPDRSTHGSDEDSSQDGDRLVPRDDEVGPRFGVGGFSPPHLGLSRLTHQGSS
jgi:hypothetical protein